MTIENQQPFSRGRVILACVLLLAAYWMIASRTTLWDRDEPRFSRATVEMVESGNYLVPTFNGEERLHKPILVYWLMSLPIRVFGATAFAARFFSGVGIMLTCLFTFLTARRMFNDRTAFHAFFILGTSIMAMAIGTFATADAVMLPWMTAAMMLFVFACLDGKMKFHYFLGIGVALGLGLLAKGPVALLPVLAMIVTMILARKEPTVKPLRFTGWILLAVIIAIGMFIAWGIPANIATEGRFLQEGLGKHVVARSTGSFEGHGGNFLLYLFFYPAIIIAGFFPWSQHIAGACTAVWGKRLGGNFGRAVLIGWTLPTVIVMTLVATKLAHYVLFIWPGLAIAAAATLDAFENGKLNEKDNKWLKAGPWFFGPVSGGITIALLVAPWFIYGIAVKIWGVLGAITFIMMGYHANKHQKQLRPVDASRAIFKGLAVFFFILIVGILPSLETFKIPPKVAAAIKENTPPEMPVAAYKFIEPSLMFYTGRHIETFDDLAAAAAWAKDNIPCALIIPFDDVNAFKKQASPVTWYKSTTVKGMNYSKSADEFQVCVLYLEKSKSESP